jgi:hypothetical protein
MTNMKIDNSNSSNQALEFLLNLMKLAVKETYSLEEAAEYLKIDTKSVEYYSKRIRELTHVNLGGTLVFRKKDLDEFLQRKTILGLINIKK